jgi:hypothetical protein
VVFKHRAPETYERDPHWRTLVINLVRHFFTISVMADRNWATSVNWR